jgi:PKD domain
MVRRSMASAALGIAACVALSATASSASGAQYCVGATGTACDGGVEPFTPAGLVAATAAANAAAGADEVRVAAGTLDNVPALTLEGASETTLTGAGATATVLRAAGGVSSLLTVTGPARIADLAIEGPVGNGLSVSGAGPRTIERVRITGANQGVFSSNGATTLRDSTIDLQNVASATGVYALGVSAAAITTTVSRVTIGGSGTGQAGIRAANFGAASSTAASASSTAIYLTGSSSSGLICTRFAGSAALAAASTAYFPAGSYTDCTQATPPTSFVDLSLSYPWFVNASDGDYRLQSSSPLIDRGALFVAAGSLDALRLPRLVDGNADRVAAVDLGAHEYQRQPPNPPTIDLPTTTVAPGQAVVFKATATDPDGEYPFIDWDFGDGSPAGGSVHAYGALGTYTATATATDPVGLTRTSQVTITVANPPAPTDPGAAPTPAPLDPFATATGPRVRVLTPPTQRIKRSTAGFATVGGAAPDVASVEVAGAPTLRVSLTRLAPGRRSKGKCRATTKAGKRCTVRVPVKAIAQIPVSPGVVHLRFGGKLGGKRLAKGTYEVSVVPVGLDKRRGVAATYPLTLR